MKNSRLKPIMVLTLLYVGLTSLLIYLFFLFL